MKLTGPMMSMSASGSIGGVLTFASNKGRAYARTLVKPSNPKSNLQNAVRAVFTFLSQVWKTIPAVDQATWQNLADQTKISPFNAFVKDGQNRTKTGTFPWQRSDGVGPDMTNDVSDLTAASTQRQAAVEVECGGGGGAWAIILYRAGPYDASGGADPSGINSEIVAMPILTAPEGQIVIDTKVIPGKWYKYQARVCGPSGGSSDLAPTSLEVQISP